jgi:VanZ family protein
MYNFLILANVIAAFITIVITSVGIQYYNTNPNKLQIDNQQATPKDQTDYNQMIAYLVYACLYLLFSCYVFYYVDNNLSYRIPICLLSVAMIVLSILSIECTESYLVGVRGSYVPIVVCTIVTGVQISSLL